MIASSRCYVGFVFLSAWWAGTAGQAQDEAASCGAGDLCLENEPTVLLQQKQSLQHRRVATEHSPKWRFQSPFTDVKFWQSRNTVNGTSITKVGKGTSNYQSSFVSDSGLICYDGSSHDVEGALALLKTGVTGTLFVNTHAVPRTSCAERGYTLNRIESTCYPNVFIYSQHDTGLDEHMVLEGQTLTNYSVTYSLSESIVQSMFACICHPQSRTIMMRASGTCALELAGIWGSWRHHDHVDHTDLTCDEGPFQYSAFVLAVMKSTPQLGQHIYDTITPGRCADYGFPYYGALDFAVIENESTLISMGVPIPMDHCFPQLSMAIATRSDKDPGALRCMDVEHELGDGAFREMCENNNWDYNVLGHGGCQCVPGSEVWGEMEEMPPEDQEEFQIGPVICSTPGSVSPIRAWWNGQPVG